MATTRRDVFLQYISSKRKSTLSPLSPCHLYWKLELPSLGYQNSKARGRRRRYGWGSSDFGKKTNWFAPQVTHLFPAPLYFLLHFIMCLIVSWNLSGLGPSFCSVIIPLLTVGKLFVDLVQTLSFIRTLTRAYPRVCAVAPFMRLINLNHGHFSRVWRGA